MKALHLIRALTHKTASTLVYVQDGHRLRRVRKITLQGHRYVLEMSGTRGGPRARRKEARPPVYETDKETLKKEIRKAQQEHERKDLRGWMYVEAILNSGKKEVLKRMGYSEKHPQAYRNVRTGAIIYPDAVAAVVKGIPKKEVEGGKSVSAN